MSQLYIPASQRRRQLLRRVLYSPVQAIVARWRYTLTVRREFPTIWNDFLRSVLIFLLVTIVGGWVYGEWFNAAYGQYLEPMTRPYIIVQLMIVEPPAEHPPPEPELLLFWYLMPPLFVLIVARGASDLFRLFLSRERAQEWRKAMASTYRDHVIVLGAGHVGLQVIKTLRQIGIDVVAIDDSQDEEVITELAAMGVPLIEDDGTRSRTLLDAGISNAEAFIACTGKDDTNLKAMFSAHHLNPHVRFVARTWEEQAAEQVREFYKTQAALSSAQIAAPLFAGLALGFEITQNLKIEGKEYSTIRLNVEEGSFLTGCSIKDLQNTHQLDIVLHGCGPDVVVKPEGNRYVQAHDTLVIFAERDVALRIAARNYRPRRHTGQQQRP